MNRRISFKEFWETISYKDTSERATNQDILLRTITCLILALVSGMLTVLNINKHFSFMTVTTGVLTVGMIVSAILCAYFKRPDIASFIIIFMGVQIFTYYAISGANEGFAILWITMVPLICMLWIGFKIGVLISLYFQVLLIVMFYTPIRATMSAHYTDMFMTRFPILYFGTLAVSSWIFYQKLKSQMASDNAARIDALTQIDNRLGYNLRLAALFQNGPIRGLHIMVFDINSLKHVNDKFGHKAGDELIIASSRVISEVFPNYEIFARVGGDEFYLISTEKDLDITERKNRLLSLTSSWKGECAPFMSISFGHSYGHNVTEENYTNLLGVADKDMYDNKARYYSSNSFDRRRAPRD